jgi:hypothetical protein
VTATRGSVRRQVRIHRTPDDVWAIVGDPTRLPEWFPGIVDSTVDGMERVIITGAGIAIPEELITIDAILRRFQYRITAPMFREHLSTIDVLDLDDGTSLVVYGVDAEPSPMALLIGGAAGNALENLRGVMERGQ